MIGIGSWEFWVLFVLANVVYAVVETRYLSRDRERTRRVKLLRRYDDALRERGLAIVNVETDDEGRVQAARWRGKDGESATVFEADFR